MNVFDIILLILLAYFMYKGARKGFVRLIGGFAGIVVGAWAAGRYYTDVADLILQFFDLSIMTSIVVSFIAIFVLVNLIITFVVGIITKVFKIIPLATTMNRLIGGFLGVIEGLLLIGLFIWIITLFPFENSFTRMLDESKVANYFEYSTQLVQPLLPDSLRDIDFTFLKDLENFSDEKAEYLKENMPTFFDKIRNRQDEFKNMVDEQIRVNEEDAAPTTE